jgi:DTW domain-containing protein YfiP
LKAKKEIAKS